MTYVVFRFKAKKKSERFRSLSQKEVKQKLLKNLTRGRNPKNTIAPEVKKFKKPQREANPNEKSQSSIVAKASPSKKSTPESENKRKRQRTRKSALLAEIEWLERKTAKLLAEQAQELAKKDDDILTAQEIENIVEQVIGDEVENQHLPDTHEEQELTPEEKADFDELFNDKYEEILNDAEHLEQIKELANLHYQALPEDQVENVEIETSLPQVQVQDLANTSVSVSADITFTEHQHFQAGTTLSATKASNAEQLALTPIEDQELTLGKSKLVTSKESICLTTIDQPSSTHKE
ncbi:hypothetical protein [Psittacicella gerlachiana]|uniref:hypothetical protein n=1 Tax=Psittacicella gerlachiana TaxID=2028574 RepID=UPI0011C3B714|nr:hypothetical protein [Psittacicella gerlachiana]